MLDYNTPARRIVRSSAYVEATPEPVPHVGMCEGGRPSIQSDTDLQCNPYIQLVEKRTRPIPTPLHYFELLHTGNAARVRKRGPFCELGVLHMPRLDVPTVLH